ncbi:MAG: YgjV family protein [Clostridia bacterium]|nr:YgjV family protein [Clostridia bacterium]
MKQMAFVVGVVAVCFYLLGYLQKKRSNIILFNVTSRILYIVQYVLLGAFEGAVLDVAGTVSSLLAQKKNVPVIKKHIRIFILLVNAFIVLAGLMVYENIYSLLPIAGVLLHTGAFWLTDEKKIRIVSFLGSPFWLAYNFLSGAYPSCVGDVLSMVSIGISMYRYDRKTS